MSKVRITGVYFHARIGTKREDTLKLDKTHTKFRILKFSPDERRKSPCLKNNLL